MATFFSSSQVSLNSRFPSVRPSQISRRSQTLTIKARSTGLPNSSNPTFGQRSPQESHCVDLRARYHLPVLPALRESFALIPRRTSRVFRRFYLIRPMATDLEMCVHWHVKSQGGGGRSCSVRQKPLHELERRCLLSGAALSTLPSSMLSCTSNAITFERSPIVGLCAKLYIIASDEWTILRGATFLFLDT